MVLDVNRVIVDLCYRQVIPLQNATHAMITCLHGRIWVTELRGEDIVLEEGATCQISSGEAVIQGLRDARFLVRKPSPEAFAALRPPTPAEPRRARHVFVTSNLVVTRGHSGGRRSRPTRFRSPADPERRVGCFSLRTVARGSDWPNPAIRASARFR